MQLPDWLTQETPEIFFNKKKGAGRHQYQFVEHTLNNLAELLESSIFLERYASRDGILQKLDPRAKFIGFMALVITVTLFQNLALIIGFYAITLVLALLARIPMGFFLKRVWLAIPLYAGIVAAPSILNIFTPGEPLIVILHFDDTVNFWIFHFDTLSITRQGVMGATIFIFRVATSVSLVVLLTMTTRWVEILKALRTVGVPQVFVLTLGMTYQYILILARIIQDMYFAKKARTIPHKGPDASVRNEQRWTASRIGFLFRKSYTMMNEVQDAMIARGFTGEVHILQQFAMRKRDIAWLLIVIAIIACFTWFSLIG